MKSIRYGLMCMCVAIAAAAWGMASLYKFVGDPDDDLKCLICI